MGGLELSGGLKGQQSVSPRHRLGSLCHVTIRPDGAKEYITDGLFEGWGCRFELQELPRKKENKLFWSAIRAKLQCNKYQIRDQNKLFYFLKGSGRFREGGLFRFVSYFISLR